MIVLRCTSNSSGILILTALAATWVGVPYRSMVATAPFLIFISGWTIMIVTMMLPTTAHLAFHYVQLNNSHRWFEILQIFMGYVGVWILIGITTYSIVQLIMPVVQSRLSLMIPFEALTYILIGVYQFTALKDRCLAISRSPLAQLLTYISWKDSFRHIRTGVHHGVFCAGTCWPLILLMFAFGFTNIKMMMIVAAVIIVEKLWMQGPWFSHAVGVACLVMAVGVLWFPQLTHDLIVPIKVPDLSF
jgi:predicted metal-binding membrane protein